MSRETMVELHAALTFESTPDLRSWYNDQKEFIHLFCLNVGSKYTQDRVAIVSGVKQARRT